MSRIKDEEGLSMKTELNGLTIDFRDAGGAGLPVILIHAFPLNQTMWDEQVADLSGLCRTITLDLRGFGGSDVPSNPSLMDDMASDVRALMAHLHIDEAVLVGLSMGGYVSLAFYRNYPGAVRALVLSDTRASADTAEGRQKRLASADKAVREGVKAIADDMIPLLLGPTALATRRDLQERLRTMIEHNSPAGVAAAQRGMAERIDSTYILAGIDCPTLIVVGSDDKLTPVSESESLRNGIPHSKLHVIKDAGHLANIEQPAAFNHAVVEFVSRLATS
jgi:pimeloyl-ACP methyl ester carboxylesterase